MSKTGKLFTILFFVLVCIGQASLYGQDNMSIDETLAVKPLKIEYSANVVCEGTPVVLSANDSNMGPMPNKRYEWTVAGVIQGSSADNITVIPTLTETEVVLSFYSDDIFIISDTAHIYLTSIPETSVKHDTICYGDEATISVTGGNYWYWLTNQLPQLSSEINIRPGATTPYIAFSSEYPINRVGYINDCYAIDTVWVVVNHGGITEITGDTVICAGSEYTYSVKGAVSVEWWDGNTQNPRNIFITGDTTISYKGINVNGCRIEGELHIGVVAVFQGEIISYEDDKYTIERDEAYCIGDTVYLLANTSAPNVRWFNGDTALETSFVANASFMTYCITSSVGGEINCAVRLEKPIEVEECVTMYFPSGFKPDGVTPVYAPVGQINPAKKYEFSIYNLVGEKVFETTDLTIGWDGKMKGKDLPTGVYVYLYRETIERFTFEKRGTITLIR